MKPQVGSLVLYRVTFGEAMQASRRRLGLDPHGPAWQRGAQAHVGNPVQAGDALPMVVTRVWRDEFGPGRPGVNGQVFLDGSDSLWITDAREGGTEGCWSWPPPQEDR